MKRGRVITTGVIVGIILGGLAIYSTRPSTSPDFHVGPPMARGKVQPQLISTDDLAILLAPDGSLWAWGGRESKLLSVLGKPTTTTRPQRIGNDSDWIKVAANGNCTLAIKSDGSLWGWGYNPNPQTVNVATNYIGRPTRIGLENDWSDIRVGAGHCLALKKGGTQVDGDRDWRAISAGAFNSYALKKDGSLWGWGLDPIAGGSRDNLEPDRLDFGRDWSLIAAGDYHLLALRTDGTIWVRGQNAGLATSGFLKGSTAEFVQVGSDANWSEIYSGSGCFYARQRDGSWWTCGSNSRIQFGFGLILPGLELKAAEATLEPWAIACGKSTTILLAQDGSVWSWGTRLGIPTRDARFDRLIQFANSVSARMNRGRHLFPDRAEPSDVRPYRVWTLPNSTKRQVEGGLSSAGASRE